MKISILPIILTLLMLPSVVHAQDLSHFLDKVLAASQLPSCDETRKALDDIPKNEFDAAFEEIKTLKDQALLNQIGEKFDQINQLSSQCPAVQDSFVNKLSRMAVQTQIDPKPQDSGKSLQDIQTFLNYALKSIENVNCETSAQKFSQIPAQTCSDAITAFQVLSPSSLPDSQYQSIATSLEKILLWVNQCPQFKQEYEKCLIPDSAHFLDISRLTPFFNLLHEVRSKLENTPCPKVASIQLEDGNLRAASEALKTLSPANFSPQDRVKIKTEMKAVYDAAKSCPEAHAFVDKLIERIFAQ